jgi:hypothetical protein
LQRRINENGIVIQCSICQILGDFGPSGSDISVSCFRFDLLATEWLELTGQEKAQYNSQSHTQTISVFTASLLSPSNFSISVIPTVEQKKALRSFGEIKRRAFSILERDKIRRAADFIGAHSIDVTALEWEFVASQSLEMLLVPVGKCGIAAGRVGKRPIEVPPSLFRVGKKRSFRL